jgi:hypothetical protein
MRIRQIATTGVAGLAAAALLTIAAGTASAATAEPCPGTGPAASLSTSEHDAFLKEMTALKVRRDAIMTKYGRTPPTSGQGQRAGQRARGAGRATGATLTTAQRSAMQAELAKWRVSRDALFAKYGITARSQGRSA